MQLKGITTRSWILDITNDNTFAYGILQIKIITEIFTVHHD